MKNSDFKVGLLVKTKYSRNDTLPHEKWKMCCLNKRGVIVKNVGLIWVKFEDKKVFEQWQDDWSPKDNETGSVAIHPSHLVVIADLNIDDDNINLLDV